MTLSAGVRRQIDTLSQAQPEAGSWLAVLEATLEEVAASVWDIAAAGATLVLVPTETTLFPLPQAQLMAEARITVWYSVPSALILMLTHLDLRELALDQLRLILFAGEVFPVKYLRQLHEAVPHAALFNLYGPTETNVCTYYEVTDIPPDRTEPFPIGRACENTDVFALDEAGRLCGVGEVGELYARGSTVMQGYWGRPEDTARVLAQNPLQPHFADPAYRTGDLVRYLPGGELEFLGRFDHQVKLRGFRIELGEIETALGSHPAVRACAVEARESVLVGYVVWHRTEPADLADLNSWLRERLPEHMVPAVFVSLERLPLTQIELAQAAPRGRIARLLRRLPLQRGFLW